MREAVDQHVPSSLVSSIYRLAPPDGYTTRDQDEQRLKRTIRRLVANRGTETVVNMIRKHPVESKEDETRKAWLVLTAYAEERKGGRQSTW